MATRCRFRLLYEVASQECRPRWRPARSLEGLLWAWLFLAVLYGETRHADYMALLVIKKDV